MKSVICALGAVAIIALFSSTIRVDAKAFFFFHPSRFDYRKDKTNDGYVSTLLYTSPFTGKQYTYSSNWMMPPASHQISYNYDWSVGGDANAQHEDAPAPTTVAPKPIAKKTIVKQVQIPAIPTSGAGHFRKQIGNKIIDAQWSYDYKPGSSADGTTAATTTTTPDDTTTIATTTTDRDLDENIENEDEE